MSALPPGWSPVHAPNVVRSPEAQARHEPPKSRQVLECASPPALWLGSAGRAESARGLAHSTTLTRGRTFVESLDLRSANAHCGHEPSITNLCPRWDKDLHGLGERRILGRPNRADRPRGPRHLNRSNLRSLGPELGRGALLGAPFANRSEPSRSPSSTRPARTSCAASDDDSVLNDFVGLGTAAKRPKSGRQNH